jgi:hypothetical protein
MSLLKRTKAADKQSAAKPESTIGTAKKWLDERIGINLLAAISVNMIGLAPAGSVTHKSPACQDSRVKIARFAAKRSLRP